MSDIVDAAAGLVPGSPLQARRRDRPEVVQGIEDCRASIFEPSDDLGLNRPLRAALGARIARLNEQVALAWHYEQRLDADEGTPWLADLAAGRAPPAGMPPLVAAVVRHADRVAATPRDSTRADIEALSAASLTDPQIVALSELIAFVSFECRVVAGLQVLGVAR